MPAVETLESRTLLSAVPLDPTFGRGGTVVDGIGFNSSADAVALQGDGKIVVAGTSSGVDTSSFAVARYNSDGSLDQTFGSGGHVVVHAGVGAEVFDQVGGLAIQPDGKIVVAGIADSLVGPPELALMRFLPDGRLDTTFGNGGMVLTIVDGIDGKSASSVSAGGVAVAGDGKIVVAGTAWTLYQGEVPPPLGMTSTACFAVFRFTAAGKEDAGFGSSGEVVTSFAPTPGGLGALGETDLAGGLALLPGGKIVVAGSAHSLIRPFPRTGVSPDFIEVSQRFALARYNRDGTLDAGFGTDGKVETGFALPVSGVAGAVALAGGKIVVAGTAGGEFALAKYTAQGALDPTFGAGGQVMTDLPGNLGSGFPGTEEATAVGLAVAPHGRLVVVGNTSVAGGI
jgi:uncharacterized delta-60 repeat protein